MTLLRGKDGGAAVARWSHLSSINDHAAPALKAELGPAVIVVVVQVRAGKLQLVVCN